MKAKPGTKQSVPTVRRGFACASVDVVMWVMGQKARAWSNGS